MIINKKFWKNKKILITGHTGFKGSWLILILKSLGSNIIGYSLHPEKKSLFNELILRKEIKNYYNDINDYKSFNKVLKKHKPQIIFHLAAQPLVIDSYKDPYYTFQTNVLGTLNVIENIKNISSIKSSVIVTTDKCYKNLNNKKKFKESDNLGGKDPYSWSKVCAEYIAESYINNYFNNKNIGLSTVRAGNVIGLGDYGKHRIIKDIIESFNNNKIIKLRYPKSIRPWQNVVDALLGYIILAEKSYNNKKYNGAWNFGPDKDEKITVEEITKKMIKLQNFKKGYKLVKNNFNEAKYLFLDSSKSLKQLKWKPVNNIDQTLEQIVEWNQTKNKKKYIDMLLNNILLNYL